MRPSALLIAVTALSVASAQLFSLDFLWTKSKALEVMDSCLGKNVTQLFVKYVQVTFDKCYNASSFHNFEMTVDSLEFLHWDKLFDEFATNSTKNSANSKENYTNSTEGNKNSIEGSANSNERSANSPEGSTNSTEGSTNSTEGSTNSTEGSTNSTEGSANSTESSVHTQLYAPLVDTLRCVFRGIGLSDEHDGINLKRIVEGYKSMGLSPSLQANILGAVDQCYELAQCLPVNQSGNSRIPEDLLRLKTYVNCELSLRNWACLKNALKNNSASCEIDFSSADRILGFSSNEEVPTTASPVTD